MKNNIEDERWRMKMTKTEMCKNLGVTLKTYNSYVNGQSAIPSTVLEKLRSLTGRSVDYLLGLVDLVG